MEQQRPYRTLDYALYECLNDELPLEEEQTDFAPKKTTKKSQKQVKKPSKRRKSPEGEMEKPPRKYGKLSTFKPVMDEDSEEDA